jgi:hypothetical protein
MHACLRASNQLDGECHAAKSASDNNDSFLGIVKNVVHQNNPRSSSVRHDDLGMI